MMRENVGPSAWIFKCSITNRGVEVKNSKLRFSIQIKKEYETLRGPISDLYIREIAHTYKFKGFTQRRKARKVTNDEILYLEN